MKMILVYIKLYFLFLFRVITLRIYVELIYWITTMFFNLVASMFNITNTEFPEYAYINLISFGVAVTLALQTTYFVSGKKGKVWDGEFGFKPDKFKD